MFATFELGAQLDAATQRKVSAWEKTAKAHVRVDVADPTVRGGGASPADEGFALRIFRAVGDALALDAEALLDAVTALSGSGPAYVYLFVKAMADAGVAEGLPPELATRMALKTIRGAEENMRRSTMDAAELIRIVASPGGTTEAALRKFADARFSDIVADALRAAAERSRELGRF